MNRISALILVALLSGCSIIKLLPLSDCGYVRYERIDNNVTMEAACLV
jgi:hypothetical protein